MSFSGILFLSRYFLPASAKENLSVPCIAPGTLIIIFSLFCFSNLYLKIASSSLALNAAFGSPEGFRGCCAQIKSMRRFCWGLVLLIMF